MRLLRMLFEHRSRRQVILKNTFWLSVAIGLSGLLEFALAVYVIRRFGATEYGKFSFAFAFVSLFSALLDFGLSPAVTREFARDANQERNFSDVLTLKVLLGAAVLLAVFAVTTFVSPDRTVRLLVMVLGGYLFFLESMNLVYALFRSRQRMELEAAFRITQALLLVVAVIVVLGVRSSVLALGLGYLGASCITLILALGYLSRLAFGGPSLRPAFNTSVWRQFASIGAYLALVKIAGDVTANSDSVMLGLWGYLRDTGWYNGAAKIHGLALFPMGLVSSAIFPALVHLHRESAEDFQRYWEAWARGTVLFAVLICAIILAHAGTIITALYSPSFAPAALALRILILKAGIIYVYGLYYHALIIFNQQRRVFVAVLCGTTVNVLLNILLIPRFSLYGAAAAAAAAHALILVLYVILATRYTTVRLFGRGLRSTSAIALVAGAFTYVGMVRMDASGANLFLSVATGVAIYVSFIFVLGRKLNVLTAP